LWRHRQHVDIERPQRLHLAAPFFSLAEPVVEAARAGTRVELLASP
jgi:hypothetical protein